MFLASKIFLQLPKLVCFVTHTSKARLAHGGVDVWVLWLSSGTSLISFGISCVPFNTISISLVTICLLIVTYCNSLPTRGVFLGLLHGFDVVGTFLLAQLAVTILFFGDTRKLTGDAGGNYLGKAR